MSNILVTGGAGYIGSHVVKSLLRSGHKVIVLDNLSKGFARAVPEGTLVVGDTGDAELLPGILADNDIDSVMHFAAWTIVPESVTSPIEYYRNNTFHAGTLIDCCIRHGVERFVFSSTAAVYGTPDVTVCDESAPTAPINPYGWSKLMAEQILRDACNASDMRHVVLRYFNVAGCDPEGEIGHSTVDATLLIKVACEAAVARRDSVTIFGTDFPTRDGTGIRDYIHVQDLAAAHINALDYLAGGGQSVTLNCGYGHGFSVREVLDVVARLCGHPLQVIEAGRRAGDPAELVADNRRLRELFDWTPAFDDLERIVDSALNWERKLAAGKVRDGRATDA